MQPPQNPYSGVPNPGDPIPSSASYSGAGVPPGRPEISFDVIGQAWQVLKSNLGTYAGATFVIAAVGGVGGGLQVALTPHSANGQQQFSAVPLLISLIFGLINMFFSAGFLRMTINHLRTGNLDFNDIFSAGDSILNLILAGILMYIGLLIGFCLCIIPGFLLIGLLLFVQPLIVDRKMGAIEAISTSFNTLKPQMFMALVFSFVIGIVAVIGALACGVGILVTAPLALISIAITYRNFFDGGSAPLTGGPTFPVAPIADPRA